MSRITQVRRSKQVVKMEEVRVPLLASQDSCLQESSEELLKDDIMVRFSARDTGKQAWGSHEPMVGDEAMVGGEAMVGDEAMVGEDQVSKTRKKKQYSGSEMMVAVFVVAFDTKKGEGSDTNGGFGAVHGLPLAYRECCGVEIPI